MGAAPVLLVDFPHPLNNSKTVVAKAQNV